MKKIIAKALALVVVLSFAMVYSPTTLQVDVVSAATGQTTTPVKSIPVPAATTLTDGSKIYVVVSGDKMWKIAQKYNLTLEQLKTLNPQIKNLNLIYVGQKIVVGLPVSASTKPETKPTTPVVVPGTGVDAVTTASIVDNAAAFEKAISKDGKWIICTTKDITINKDLVLEGTFKNGKKDTAGNDIIQRKIGPYTQDDKHVVTAKFTITAPKLTILSPEASFQHGTFKGDIYVSVKNFKLVDAKVDGNVYFTTKEAYDTFKPDDKSTITGEKALLQVDAVTTASIVNTATAFEKAISKNGTWIAATLRDITINKDLVLEGTFKNGKKDAAGNDIIQRKIGPYTQDDKHVVTAKFTITAPKLTILSPEASFQHGTFKGDIYVSVKNFKLVDAKVDGNIYFTTEEAKTTFTMDDKSSVTGEKALLQVDAVTTASIVNTATAFEKAISKNGTWIAATLRDITINKDLVLEGIFKNGKKDAAGKDIIQRKIGPYTQDDKRVITARFTITAPKLTILSPEASFQHGTFKGDIYVSVRDFKLVDAKVDGNIYFTTEEAKTTFTMDDKSSVTGKQELKTGVDAVTSASLVDNESAFEKSLGKTGTWIISTLKSLVFDKDLVLEGEFKNGKKDTAGNDIIQRKIALYTQDDKRAITARFTLTAPKLTITSPEASIQHGTFKGDLYVSVKNFKLVDTLVDGNIYFTTEEAKATFTMDAASAVTGKQELKK